MRRFGTLAPLLFGAVFACSARTGSTAHFARDLGLATAAEVVEKTHRVFTLHQFEIEQEETEPIIWVETRWKQRSPFPDEHALGISDAQVRAIMRARRRSATSTLGDIYTVDLTIEQRVRVLANDEWRHSTLTPGARAFAARITEDLKRELNVGVRRY